MSSKAEPAARNELIEKIVVDIKKSGFPLEVEILNICSTKNTGRLPSLRYEYLDQLREIDLVAFFEKIAKETVATPQHTVTELIIECKKSAEKPWVFFSSSSYAFDNVACFLKYTSEFDLHFSGKQSVPLLAQIYPRLTASHYVDPVLPRCIAYYEAFRGTSSPSEIYKAIDSVITYLCYASQARSKRRREFGVFTEFYLPTIVLDGCLFEASLDGGRIQVRERSHVQVRTFHRGDIYIIDVVTRDHFPKFFGQIECLHKEITSAISKLRFPPEFVAAVRARWKAELNSPDREGTLTMAMEDAKRRAKASRKSAATKQ